MNVISALIAPVLLPYFLWAMTVSTNPAANGDNNVHYIESKND